MSKKNLLIVCLSIKNIDRVFNLDFSNFAKVIVASDDLKVHKKIKDMDLAVEVIFLQKSISYLKVSDSVMSIIDNVNSYFFKVSEKGIFFKEDIFWPHLVEGGDNQLLQDLLIMINSAYLILDHYEISELITIGYEDALPIKIYKKIAHIRSCNITSISTRILLDKIVIKNFLRLIYLFFKSFIFKVRSNKVNFSKQKNIVLFQIDGNSKKNIDNALFLQNEFYKNGFTPINILWGSTQEVKKINKRGYKAISLEYYLKYKNIFFSLWYSTSIIRKFGLLKNLFYSNYTFTYKEVDIRDLIFESIIKYLYTVAPENYKYRVAVQRFALEYSKNIVAIKYSAPKFQAKSTILSNVIEDKYLKFDYDSGLRAINPQVKYGSYKNHNFLSNNFIRFSSNEFEKKIIMEEMNVSNDSIIIYGPGKASQHFENKKHIKKSKSMKKIGIKKNYEFYILIPFNHPLIGYQSLDEVYNVLNTIIEFAKMHKNIAAIIKPKRLTDLSYLSDFIDYKYENVYLIDRDELLDHALNISDVIFCKSSNLGREAMIYDQQVVSVILDNEKNSKFFGDAAHYISSIKELKFFLEKTFYSKDNFIKWKNSFREKKTIFLNKTYPKLEKKSDEIVVQAVKKKLDNKYIVVK
jgi:hypothetical protein